MRLPRDPRLIEKAVAELFGRSKPKALIARIICRDGSLSPEVMDKIKIKLEHDLPNDFKQMKRDLLRISNQIEKALKDHFKSNHKNTIAHNIELIESIASRNNIEAYFIGEYPREMVRTGSLDAVRNLEIYVPNSEKAKLLSGFALVSHGDLPSSCLPYMKILGCKDDPFERFSFSKDLTIDSLGIRIGRNEILDPTRRGVSDCLKGNVASIFAPALAIKIEPKLAFKAVRRADALGFKIDNNLAVTISKASKEIVNAIPIECLFVEIASLSKSKNARLKIMELGIGGINGQ